MARKKRDDDIKLVQGQKAAALAEHYTKERDEWIKARVASGVEERWWGDLQHFAGREYNEHSMSDRVTNRVDTRVLEQGSSQTKERRSNVFVNVTCPKTESAYSRIANMLFPVDQANWSYEPTPVPALQEQLSDQTVLTEGGVPIQKQDGTALTAGDAAKATMEIARQKCSGMEKEVQDQLVECQYNAEGRKVIRAACILGTGIMKGPIVHSKINRRWDMKQAPDGSVVSILSMVEDKRPMSAEKSCWDVYPDPFCGENPHDGVAIWDRERLSKRALRDLMRVDGYDADAIKAVLSEPPQLTLQFDIHQQEMLIKAGVSSATMDSRYEVWTRTGDMERDELEALGVKIKSPLPKEISDSMTMSGVLVMVNGRVIKAMINPLETGDLPYDFFHFSKDDGSPWGFGVPYKARSGQRIFNSAWRMVLDRGAVGGPQVVLKRDQVEPADGDYTIRGRKAWLAASDVDDVRKAMEVYNVQTNIDELMSIIRFTMEFMDIETGVPMLLQGQGERQPSAETLGGLTMQMNFANEFLRSIAKSFDDDVTTPHLRRYYDWNMMYNPKDDIKGDYQVNAKGSSALVVRDIQNQAIIQLAGLANNPVWSVGLKKWPLLRKLFEANHLTASEFVEADEVIAANEQRAAESQQDPRLALEQFTAQAKMQQLAFDRETAYAIEQMRLKDSILKYAASTKLGEDKVKAMLAQTAMTIKRDKELFLAETALKLSPQNPTNEGI